MIAPLEDAWKRIDPKEDGWDSEVLNEVATKKLKALSEIILSKTLIKEKDQFLWKFSCWRSEIDKS